MTDEKGMETGSETLLDPDQEPSNPLDFTERMNLNDGRSENSQPVHSLFAPAVANFGVQYNYGCISIALMFLKDEDLYQDDDTWGQKDGTLSSVLKSIVFLGSIFGMVFMGWVGDILGRNRAFSLTTAIMVVSALLSATATWGNGNTMYTIFAVCRFFLGFGIGGVYPLSAAKASEESAQGAGIWERNKRTGLSFMWQSLGAIAPYLVGMAVYKTVSSPQLQFRLLLGLGAIPPFITMCSTWGAEDSPEFRRLHATRKSPLEQVRLGLSDPRWLRNLVATGVCWFLYDISYYGNALFTPTMTNKIFTGDGLYEDAWRSALEMCIGVPAGFHAVLMLKHLGPKRLQVVGFLAIAACSAAIALSWNKLVGGQSDDSELSDKSARVLFILYCFLQFTVNWGPGLTTFVLPQQIYATPIRGTFNGLAAALGKLGAISGIWIFDEVANAFGIIALMWVLVLINVLAAVLSSWAISDTLWQQQLAEMQAMEALERTDTMSEIAHSEIEADRDGHGHDL